MEVRAQTRVIGSGVLIAVVALGFGFLLAGQLRAQLLNPSNRVARNEALVRSVQDLEKTNAEYRARINALRTEMTSLEAQAAAGSDSTRRLQEQDRELKQRAGLTPLRGPGVNVDLANGRPGTDPEGVNGYLVNFADVQDVVNLLFEGGAEGVALNGHRISPLSSFRGAAGAIVVDQGPPLLSPYRVSAVGNRSQMEQLLADSSKLGNLRSRVTRFQIQFGSSGSPELALPAFDSALEAPDAIPSEALPARPRRRQANAIAVGVLALVLAFVGAVQFRSQAAVERSLLGQDNTSLAFLIDDLHKANDELAVEQSTIAARRDTLKSGSTAAAGAQLSDEIKRLEVVLGAVPVRGPGVVVTIDAPLQVLDLQDALNNLRVGGAEAIDLNGHRVLTTSVFRPAIAGVSVDGSPIRPPYVFTVVGNASRLAVVADVMTRSLHTDPRVRSAAYETAPEVSIRSTAAQRPFVYGGS